MSIGGIEAGGTKWTCGVGDGDGGLARVESFPTTTPEETIGRAVEFFAAVPDLEALGVGAFGPVDLKRSSSRWGRITTTPKPRWTNTDVVSPLAEALGVPIALDTDVNAAAVGEWHHGAASGLDTFCYITVGTGIGGGVFANGGRSTACSIPRLATCWSRTTVPAIPSRAPVPTRRLPRRPRLGHRAAGTSPPAEFALLRAIRG